jgi:hypothetical protein
MKWASRSWWQEPLRVELDEIMDDLDPGWSRWRDAADRALAEPV